MTILQKGWTNRYIELPEQKRCGPYCVTRTELPKKWYQRQRFLCEFSVMRLVYKTEHQAQFMCGKCGKEENFILREYQNEDNLFTNIERVWEMTMDCMSVQLAAAHR